MKVGMIGLGKLGMPVATAMQMKGHDVMGYDVRPEAMTHDPVEYVESGPDGTGHVNEWIERFPIKFGSIEEIVEHSDLVFVAVQTPHDEKYEGHVPIPADRVDFDYSYLVEVMENVCYAAREQGKEIPVAVISTVLPTTMAREVYPIVMRSQNFVKLVYNPSFIAMGTTMRDFIDPEFTLVGVNDEGAAKKLVKFYETITDAPVYTTTVENAELIKVAYNTFIGLKIVFANTMMEICHKLPGCDVDGVTNALKLAHRRLIAPTYMDGGMGDGGGCHPRDNIALSWLARKLNLSHDIFEDVMMCREHQAAYLCNLVREECQKNYLVPFVLGKAFKANVGLTVGSPANLCAHMLGYPDSWDPFVDSERELFPAAVYLVAARHDCFVDFKFPDGSVVIDPWRFIPDREGIKVIHVGGVR
jgi:UDPglucose 6-dehydrogenase